MSFIGLFAVDCSDKQQFLPCLVIGETNVPALLHESQQPNAPLANFIGSPILVVGDFDFRVRAVCIAVAELTAIAVALGLLFFGEGVVLQRRVDRGR